MSTNSDHRPDAELTAGSKTRDAAYYCKSAQAFFNSDDHSRATVYWQLALAEDQNCAEAHLGLGKLFIMESTFNSDDIATAALEKALDHLSKAVEIGLSHDEAFVLLAVAQFKSGSIPQAMTTIEAGLRLFPNSSDLCNGIGACYGELSNYRLAKYWLLESVRLNPNDREAWENLVFPQLAYEDFGACIKAAEKAIILGSKKPEVYYNAAVAYFRKSRYNDALQKLSISLKLSWDPEGWQWWCIIRAKQIGLN